MHYDQIITLIRLLAGFGYKMLITITDKHFKFYCDRYSSCTSKPNCNIIRIEVIKNSPPVIERKDIIMDFRRLAIKKTSAHLNEIFEL